MHLHSITCTVTKVMFLSMCRSLHTKVVVAHQCQCQSLHLLTMWTMQLKINSCLKTISIRINGIRDLLQAWIIRTTIQTDRPCFNQNQRNSFPRQACLNLLPCQLHPWTPTLQASTPKEVHHLRLQCKWEAVSSFLDKAVFQALKRLLQLTTQTSKHSHLKKMHSRILRPKPHLFRWRYLPHPSCPSEICWDLCDDQT